MSDITDFADRVLAEIKERVEQHDGEMTDEEREYVAGLNDASSILRSAADRLR